MDEGRLGAVRRQQDHHRKSTIVMNDIINFQQNVYTCYLNREQQNTQAKMKAQEVFMKRSIARNSYLLQCLEARKQKIAERAPEKQILGRYGGRPIHAFTRDVDACIAWRHPRLRRLRRVERAKEKGLKLGAIMDFDTIPEKMEAIFGKGQDKDDVAASKEVEVLPGPSTTKLARSLRIRNQSSFGMPNILKIQHDAFNKNRPAKYRVDESYEDGGGALQQNFEQDQVVDKEIENKADGIGHTADDEEYNNTATDRTKAIGQDGVDIILNHKSSFQNTEKDVTVDDKSNNKTIVPSPPPLVRRPTLILPPIKTTKEMKVGGFKGL